jgi:hypothetical protein
VSDVAQWLTENREDLAGWLGVPAPEDVTVADLETASTVLSILGGDHDA